MSDAKLETFSSGDIYQARMLIHQMIKDAFICKDTLSQINESLEAQQHSLDSFINTRVHLSMMLRAPSMCTELVPRLQRAHEHMALISNDIKHWLFIYDTAISQCANVTRLYKTMEGKPDNKVAISSWKSATVRYLDLLYQLSKLYFNIVERVAAEPDAEAEADGAGRVAADSLVGESERMTAFTSFVEAFGRALRVPSEGQYQGALRMRKARGHLHLDAACWAVVNVPTGSLCFYACWLPLLARAAEQPAPPQDDALAVFPLLLYSATPCGPEDSHQIKLQTPSHSFIMELQSAHQRNAWLQAISEGISFSLSNVNLNSSSNQSSNYNSQLTQQLQQVPGNDKCADCLSPSPTWCSISLGVMVCHKCSGVHRSLSSSVSKVRSTTLDKLEDTLPLMLALGNMRVNSVYMANAPPPKHCLGPTSSQSERSEWIGRKYVQLQFVSPLAEYDIDSLLEVDLDDDASVISAIHVISQLDNDQLEAVLCWAVRARNSFLSSFIALRCECIPADTVGDALQMEMWDFVKLLIYAGSQLTDDHLDQLDAEHRAIFAKPMIYIGDSSDEDEQGDVVQPLAPMVTSVSPGKKSPRILSVNHGVSSLKTPSRPSSPSSNRRSLQGLLKRRESGDKVISKPRIRKKKSSFGKEKKAK